MRKVEVAKGKLSKGEEVSGTHSRQQEGFFPRNGRSKRFLSSKTLDAVVGLTRGHKKKEAEYEGDKPRILRQRAGEALLVRWAGSTKRNKKVERGNCAPERDCKRATNGHKGQAPKLDRETTRLGVN